LQGAKKGDIRAIAVATDISPPASPCGMCRQFIREFCEVSLHLLYETLRPSARLLLTPASSICQS